MPLPLLELPPELLIQILTTLPVKPLLKFSQTSRYARALAYSNLHTLSLAIYPSRRSSRNNRLIPTHLEPKLQSHRDHDPHKILVRIPQAWDFDYPTLLSFHTAVVADILNRHACTLHNLDLSLWTLSIPIAKAICTLPALRSLSLRIESVQYVPRPYLNVQRKEERTAWDLLAVAPTWPSQIHTLRIENAEVTTGQLSSILSKTARLADLHLRGCDMLTGSFWESSSLASLHSLRVIDCSNVHMKETALDAISKMIELQVRQSNTSRVAWYTISGPS
jgi:hypothetical protein